MSINAMSWAMDQDIFPSTAKFVLVCLCDNVGSSEIVFPSLETLCKKTSQDRKTVISCLDRLCEIGLLKEEGTKPGGVKQYRIIGLPDGDTHYVYRLNHIHTEEYYIGVRTCCTKDVFSDDYFGSGRWPQEIGKKLLLKEILGIYATRKEAELAEAFLLNSHKGHEKLKNKFFPRAWQVPKTPPVPKTVPVPKTELGSSENGMGGSSENGMGVVPKTEHRIVNEPSVGTKKEPNTPSAPADEELQAVCRTTWKSYSDAYFHRYQVEPIRNATVNTHIKAFCKKIPQQEAPHVAAFYVSHNDKFYVQKTHSTAFMSKDAEGLRTQWATGRTMTSTRANQLDSTATNANAAQEAIAMLRRRNGNASV